MIANMRTNVAMAFGDDASQAAYERECEDARAKQSVRFAVAPRQSVTSPSGHVYRAGEAVEVSMLHGGGPDCPAPWRLLESWVLTGKVLEANSPVLSTDETAKHRVAAGTSTVTRAGILGSGRAISADMLEGGAAALADLVARGAVVATK